ncbi:uroporphyrinogen-III C-methyltransferase [Schauerella aestuarii]|uniref:uroporphyrinogen-III C-methyltransferase n=1 Tax=Schauerella aestuarii TaxID=2511204 RepID=UPI0038B34EA7
MGRTIPPPPPPSGRGPGKPGKRGGLPVTVIILVLLCLAMGSALWFQRQQSEKAGREIASRLDGLSTQLEQTRNSARESLALSQAQAGKVAGLENALREAQSQYSALEQAWQSFNDTGSDDVLLNDIDRLLTIASQQLRLAGNVNNAIVALETAQSRLARADRPRFASLQESINGDLDRLRGVATVDVGAQSARIDRLAAMVMRAPLLVPDGAVPGGMATGTPLSAGLPAAAVAVEPALPADAPWYQHWRAEIASWPSRAGSSLAHELGDLIRVQRVDQPEALILSPEQADQLRATVRQRLLAVQLSLLMRQPAIWQSEMQNVVTTLTRYFDTRAADTAAALTLARELEQTRIADPLPDVTNSLNAVAAMRAATATPREQG